MRRLVAVAALVVALVSPSSSARDADAREAAVRFGHALTDAKSQTLRSILPEHGKVRVSLDRFGPTEGLFGAGQVEAIFRDFLAHGSVESFEVVRSESDERSYSIVHARAVLIDRRGRTGRVGLHLSFAPETSRWVLREVKETRE